MNSLKAIFFAFLIPQYATAQTSSYDCLPPIQPSGVVSDDLLRDFGQEIRAEYDQYFDDAQTYLNCLAAASASAQAEIKQVLDTYSEIFPRQ